MTTLIRHTAAAAAVLALAMTLHAAATVVRAHGSASAAGPSACPDGTEAYVRVELFFGLSRPGAVISEAEFQAFVDEQITPRFPAGLTLLAGSGRFRDARGALVTEASRLLILLVPRNGQPVDAQVEVIRAHYRQAFEQQSVLRADAAACVSF